jgi:hypothetical protein
MYQGTIWLCLKVGPKIPGYIIISHGIYRQVSRRAGTQAPCADRIGMDAATITIWGLGGCLRGFSELDSMNAFESVFNA